MVDFVELQKTKSESENSWTIDIKSVDTKSYDLSCKNPNKKNGINLRSPEDILGEIEILDKETKYIINQIKEMI